MAPAMRSAADDVERDNCLLACHLFTRATVSLRFPINYNERLPTFRLKTNSTSRRFLRTHMPLPPSARRARFLFISPFGAREGETDAGDGGPPPAFCVCQLAST